MECPSSLALDRPFQHHRLSSELKLATGHVCGIINPSAPLSTIITNRPIHGNILSISSDCSLDPQRVNISACTIRCSTGAGTCGTNYITRIPVFRYSDLDQDVSGYKLQHPTVADKNMPQPEQGSSFPPLLSGLSYGTVYLYRKDAKNKPKADGKHKTTSLNY